MVKTIALEELEKVKQSGNCLIVFGSAWCRDCVRIEPFLKDLSQQYAHLLGIYKIDSQKEELGSKFNIRSIPTLIFYRDGSEVGQRLIEPQSKNVIEEEIKNNFDR